MHQYSLLMSEPREIAVRLKDFLDSASHALTQWFAGWLRHPYTVPPAVTAFVLHFPEASKLEKQLSARRVEDGGRLWLVVPKDEGLLRETQTVDGFTLAATCRFTSIYSAQVYVGTNRRRNFGTGRTSLVWAATQVAATRGRGFAFQRFRPLTTMPQDPSRVFGYDEPVTLHSSRNYRDSRSVSLR